MGDGLGLGGGVTGTVGTLGTGVGLGIGLGLGDTAGFEGYVAVPFGDGLVLGSLGRSMSLCGLEQEEKRMASRMIIRMR